MSLQLCGSILMLLWNEYNIATLTVQTSEYQYTQYNFLIHFFVTYIHHTQIAQSK